MQEQSRESSQCWFMDSGCSKHMTERTKNFLSLKEVEGGSVSFGNGKKGYILGIGKIGKNFEKAIEDVYYVRGLKYSVLSVSQICDKGNEVKFLSDKCTITNLQTKEVIPIAKRWRNMYVANLRTIEEDNLTCLKVQDESSDLWHRRLGRASLSLMTKLASKDLVRGLPRLNFSNIKICTVCTKGK